MRRAPALVAAAALLVAIAGPAEAAPTPAEPAAADACAGEAKKLKTFKRGMAAAKRRFFRTHRAKKARTRFVKKQKAKLTRLTRALRRCRARPAPGSGTPDPGGGQPGPPEPLATSAIHNVISPDASLTSSEISEENGVQYVRTQLELELASGATVAQMQALLSGLNAQVVSSLEGVPILTVRMPDPGSLAALRALVAGLAGTPGLAHADIPTVPVTTELPSIIPASDVTPVRPQLASFASGAWNARAALTGATAPTLVVTDYWGQGPPGPEVAVQETAADFASVNPNSHGYTMLGLLAGTFAPGAVSDPAADRVTGTWPGPDLPLRVVDLSFQIASSTLEDRLIQMVQALPGDVVVSTSLAAGCAPTRCTVAEIQTDALQWITRVRASGLESRFVHVVAAGNIYPSLPTDTAAVLGSHFIAAAHMALPGSVANLTNTIVVENTTSSDPADGPLHPVCLTDSSKRGGDISAVGNDIQSLSAPGVFRDLPLGGTSSAAPQVAGAAATVWTLDSGLTPAGVVGILRNTARPIDVDASLDLRCDPAAQPAPGLDEYAAVLAADRAGSTPVRETIMDVANTSGALGADGVFDEGDLSALRNQLTVNPVPLDYGRFDLNGDGYTGGGTTRMDLDGVRPVAWGFSQRRDILGVKVLRDENAVRDLDVLCHEATGPRYAGDVTARNEFAKTLCLPTVALFTDPAFPGSVSPGRATQLRIVALDAGMDPAAAELPGVRLEISAVGGTVGAATGVTGADGSFTTTATLVSPATQIDIQVIARAGAGGPELDRINFTAFAGSGPVTVGAGRAFLVANAEGADDVKEFESPNFSGAVSAADKDANASGTGSSALQLSSGGMEFTGSANISASDDGGGGDASVSIERHFTVTTPLAYRLTSTLGGTFVVEQTDGHVWLQPVNGPFEGNPFASRTTPGSGQINGFLGAGDYLIDAAIGCQPDFDGGTCTGNFSFSLELGDLIGP